jgi:hypothetical protein
VLFDSKYNLWCNSDVNNIWGVKIKSRQLVYFLKELKLKTKISVRKNSKRSLRASYSHDKALQTLFGEDIILYNCSNKPLNASVFFCSKYHEHSACWSGLFNYLFIMPNIGGVENFFGGVDILFGGL